MDIRKGHRRQACVAYFVDPPTGKERIAAARYGNEVSFTLDVGPSPCLLSIYFLDFDKKDRQTVRGNPRRENQHPPGQKGRWLKSQKWKIPELESPGFGQMRG